MKPFCQPDCISSLRVEGFWVVVFLFCFFGVAYAVRLEMRNLRVKWAMGQLKTLGCSSGWRLHCHTYAEDCGEGHTRFPGDELACVVSSPDEECRQITDLETGRDDQTWQFTNSLGNNTVIIKQVSWVIVWIWHRYTTWKHCGISQMCSACFHNPPDPKTKIGGVPLSDCSHLSENPTNEWFQLCRSTTCHYVNKRYNWCFKQKD